MKIQIKVYKYLDQGEPITIKIYHKKKNKLKHLILILYLMKLIYLKNLMKNGSPPFSITMNLKLKLTGKKKLKNQNNLLKKQATLELRKKATFHIQSLCLKNYLMTLILLSLLKALLRVEFWRKDLKKISEKAPKCSFLLY